MAATGRYVWDPVAKAMVKVADKVPSRGTVYTSQEKPFAQQIIEGYKNAYQRGVTRHGWKASTIKRVWGNS